MNIEFDAYKQKLNDCRPALDGLADSLSAGERLNVNFSRLFNSVHKSEGDVKIRT